MKTKEELEQIKEEYTELRKKLAELSEEELKQVVGGISNCKPYGLTNSAIDDVGCFPGISSFP